MFTRKFFPCCCAKAKSTTPTPLSVEKGKGAPVAKGSTANANGTFVLNPPNIFRRCWQSFYNWGIVCQLLCCWLPCAGALSAAIYLTLNLSEIDGDPMLVIDLIPLYVLSCFFCSCGCWLTSLRYCPSDDGKDNNYDYDDDHFDTGCF